MVGWRARAMARCSRDLAMPFLRPRGTAHPRLLNVQVLEMLRNSLQGLKRLRWVAALVAKPIDAPSQLAPVYHVDVARACEHCAQAIVARMWRDRRTLLDLAPLIQRARPSASEAERGRRRRCVQIIPPSLLCIRLLPRLLQRGGTGKVCQELPCNLPRVSLARWQYP